MERLILSTQEYFALPHASNSGIKEAHQIFQARAKGLPDPTKAYRFGSAFDALLTDMQELTLDGMHDHEIKQILGMKKALERDAIYNALFKEADKQAVFTDTTEIDGFNIPRKCKYDLWSEFTHFGGDLKSTTATSQQAFEAACTRFEYPQQAAWYMDITDTDRFVIIGISKSYPHNIFHISIKRNDPLYCKGKESYLQQAISWVKLNIELCS